MKPAMIELANVIDNTKFDLPICPVFQNVVADPITDPLEIKKNLVAQVISPVRWTQSIQKMIKYGITEFIDVGPGKVLQGLVRKISPDVKVSGLEN